MSARSDEDGSKLDLNLSLHSLNTSTLSNDLHPSLNLAHVNTNGKEPVKLTISKNFEEGSSQSNALSTISRKRNRQEDEVAHHRGGSHEEDVEYSRKKLRLSWDQTLVLEDSFKRHSTLNAAQKERLANELGIQSRQVEVWFQNRRARIKVKQTEAEVDYMKQNCLSLVERIRHLQKEVNDLRALNLQSQFHSQIPTSTTLTMCNSCKAAGPVNASRVGPARESASSVTSRAPTGPVKREP